MTKPKHTLGKWEAITAFDHPNSWLTVIETKEIEIARYSCYIDPDDFKTQSENLANARLIAAAPCMLEQLQYLSELLNKAQLTNSDPMFMLGILRGIRKAIARAQGEKS